MSLINEVLRDLDARHAAASERSGLAPQVRALPPRPPSLLRKILLPALAAVLGGAAVWFWLQSSAPVPPAPEPVPPAVTTAEPPPVVLVPEPDPVRIESFRLDEGITVPAERPAPAAAAKAPAKPAAAAPEKPAQPEKQGKPIAPAAPAEAPAQINKQPAGGGGGSVAEQAEAEYRRGLAALRRGAAAEAGEALRAALKLQPAHAAARQALLGQLVEQRQWQAVEVVALDGLGLLPARSEWALLAARVQYDRGEFAPALDTLIQYAQGARQNPDYQVFLALLLQRAQRHAEAVTAYQAALALRPGEGRWWFGLGRALDAEHRDAEARQAYERARDSGSLSPEMQQQVERRLK